MKKSINAVIVDDERLARELIKKYLLHFPEINLVAECGNAFEAVKSINEIKPELVFLDIQLPKINGFEILELIDCKPSIIFSTAYDEFAIKAFEVSAVDYLLKPYNQERFDAAVIKAMNIILVDKENSSKARLALLKENITGEIKKIILKKNNEIIIIPLGEVYYLEAQDDFVNIVSSKGKYLKYNTLKYYEDNLPSETFIRVHRSFIINLSCVKKIEHFDKGNYKAILTDNTKVPISRSGFERLRNYF